MPPARDMGKNPSSATGYTPVAADFLLDEKSAAAPEKSIPAAPRAAVAGPQEKRLAAKLKREQASLAQWKRRAVLLGAAAALFAGLFLSALLFRHASPPVPPAEARAAVGLDANLPTAFCLR